MAQPKGILYEVRWNEICPWLILVQALRVSVMVRVLGLAFVGVLLTQWGWAAIDGVFADHSAGLEELTDPAAGPALEAATSISQVVARIPDFEELAGHATSGPLVRAWSWLAQPFAQQTSREASWQRSLALSLSGIWTIAVWALWGGAITRISGVYLTRGETLGPLSALKAALAKWGATAGSPLIVLLGVGALAVPMVFDGILLRLDFLAMLAGFLWILVLGWGMLLALALLGLLVGWPLMWATLAVERTDAFDGVSRCYAYVYQRPLHLMFYVVVATALGYLGELVVNCFAVAAVVLSEWTISWGAGNLRTAELVTTLTGDAQAELGTMLTIGGRSVQFWKWMLQAVAASFSVGYLWSASVGIYLLLRRQVDGIEMDEIAFEPGEMNPKALSELATDETGVPQIDPEGRGMTDDGDSAT
ncbi:MAG: hypothetical protein KDA57_07295 [Planctomycetales bacterium]|nr:hypothetical protein [Planctomycetales bacterium]